jgi:hypothetical protein
LASVTNNIRNPMYKIAIYFDNIKGGGEDCTLGKEL